MRIGAGATGAGGTPPARVIRRAALEDGRRGCPGAVRRAIQANAKRSASANAGRRAATSRARRGSWTPRRPRPAPATGRRRSEMKARPYRDRHSRRAGRSGRRCSPRRSDTPARCSRRVPLRPWRDARAGRRARAAPQAARRSSAPQRRGRGLGPNVAQTCAFTSRFFFERCSANDRFPAWFTNPP